MLNTIQNRLNAKFWAVGLTLFVLSGSVFADDTIPECLAYGRPLPINNAQVLHWKRTTSNQFRERGNIAGPITEIYPDRNGHEHFVINIGKHGEDTIEVIYNQDFGAVPDLRIGMMVQACGDYITSTAQSGPYPPSPVGAIIHWVHANPSGKGHDSGFMVVDGKLYGQDTANAGPKPRPNKPKPRPRPRQFEGDIYGQILEALEF